MVPVGSGNRPSASGRTIPRAAEGRGLFEICADGTKAPGLLTNAMPPRTPTADGTGAQVVRLVVTDGGDGDGSDHAARADARISCRAGHT